MDYKWICRKCTLINVGTLKCTVCDTLRCTHDVGKVCFVCCVDTNNGAVVHQRELGDDDADWPCSVCTYLNKNSANVCEICGIIRKDSFALLTDRPETPNELLDISPCSSTWRCAQCTLKNSWTERKCRVCGFIQDEDTSWQSVSLEFCQTCSSLCEPLQDCCEKTQSHLLLESHRMEDLRLSQELEALAISENICKFCEENKVKFIDDSFLPVSKSLYINVRKPLNEVNVSCWLRPNEFSCCQWVVYDMPSPQDICQGSLGNCWLLSSLALLANKPDLLVNIIQDRYSKHGVYHVRLCRDGKWQTILIDDLFPCCNNRFAFSRAKRNQLWVPLIEKAMAKMYGCYEALTGGLLIEGLSVLTGAPCDSISLQEDHHELWANLLSSRESGFLMCASTLNKVSNNLQPSHAYSILDVRDVQGNRLLKLRNPWGSVVWTGKWSDNSSAWNQIHRELRKKLLDYGEVNGAFWMNLKDFIKYFSPSVSMCKVNPDWREARIPGHFSSQIGGSFDAVILTVKKDAEFVVSLFQENSRSQKSGNYNPTDLHIIILRLSSHDFSRMLCISHTKRKVTSVVTVTSFLKEGQYLILTLGFKAFFSEHKVNVPYMLVIHCLKVFIIKEISLHHSVLTQGLLEFIFSRGKQEMLTQDVFFYTYAAAGNMIAVQNRSTKPVRVRCVASKSKNVVSSRGQQWDIIDQLPPLSSQILLILSHNKKNSPYHSVFTVQIAKDSPKTASEFCIHKPQPLEFQDFRFPHPFLGVKGH